MILFQIWDIFDDCADDPSFARQSKMLHSLYARGCHNMINTITATQKFNAIQPVIKVNATQLNVYRLRNIKDLDTFIDEVTAVLDKKALLQIYNIATSEPCSFLNVKLTTKDKNDMLYQNFNTRLKNTLFSRNCVN